MQVIIAEKPSVAREIAAIVGATNRKDGFIEGNGYAVTWAFGHLVGLAMPQQYGIAGFRRENLPILPSSFILLPRQVREGKEYKADPGVVKKLGILRELFGMAERIIVATDAGREGELIFRYIYSYLECRTPFVRLWISSLTDRAIREGLQHLRPGNEYDNLYLSAKARSEADWIVGINASQALAVAAGRGVWSLGRVQTPTLAIICSRYLENKAFKPATYFRLKLSTAKEGTEFTVLSTEKFDGRDAANDPHRCSRGGRCAGTDDHDRVKAPQQALHQGCALGCQQVAAHHHDDGIQHQCAQAAGDECTELLRHLPALGPAAEHERPVGGVGKQDAQDVVQHVAPAVGGGVAEQVVEQGIQHDVEQGGQHAKDQVTEHFPVLFEKFNHKK